MTSDHFAPYQSIVVPLKLHQKYNGTTIKQLHNSIEHGGECQMLYVNSDGTIQLTRGDTARFNLTIKNNVSQTDYEIQPDDTLTMSIKKSVRDVDSVVQLSIKGSSVFHLRPSDTSNLAFGKYLYDVQITTGDGDVYTVIGPTTFEVMKEVTTNV